MAACESLPVGTGEPIPRPARNEVRGFDISGRLAVRRDQERHQANVEWHHRAEADSILLTGPLGQGVAELTRDARGARLVTADKQAVGAADWEELSQRVFGFALPLAGLPRWLLADVRPTAVDFLGRPQTAHEAGWDIRYLAYESELPRALPVLIELRRDEAELRLKIDTWQTN